MENATVLVVEDNKTLQMLYSYQLTQAGFTVITAETTSEALKQLQLTPIQFLLLDILLPDKNGLIFLEELRQDPRFAKLPVLVMTSLPEEVAYEKSQALGISGYLVKDQTTPEQLVQRVKLALSEATEPTKTPTT